MNFKGQITCISPTQTGTSKSGRQWSRQDVILVYDTSKPEYPKAVKFAVLGENIAKFNFTMAAQYEVELDFSVREYQGKYYMDATCWKATPLSQTPPPPAAIPCAPDCGTNTVSAPAPQQLTANDLPF